MTSNVSGILASVLFVMVMNSGGGGELWGVGVGGVPESDAAVIAGEGFVANG